MTHTLKISLVYFLYLQLYLQSLFCMQNNVHETVVIKNATIVISFHLFQRNCTLFFLFFFCKKIAFPKCQRFLNWMMEQKSRQSSSHNLVFSNSRFHEQRFYSLNSCIAKTKNYSSLSIYNFRTCRHFLSCIIHCKICYIFKKAITLKKIVLAKLHFIFLNPLTWFEWK